MLNKEQVDKIGEAFARRRGNRPCFQEELDVIDDFCNGTACAWALLQAVMDGSLMIDVKDGEAAFVISQEGSEQAEHLLRTSDDAKALWARLKEKAPPTPAEPERFAKKSLCARLLVLLYFQKEPIPLEAMAKILDTTESGVLLAIESLKAAGMISRTDDGDDK